MDLYSGMPYWLVKNPLDNYFNPLRENIYTRVAVIGSGITGALVANELCRNGIECVVVDKRSLSTGSSVASTALLQYEIDVPLCRLVKKVGEQDAVEAYRSCLRSIDDLAKVFAAAGFDPSFSTVPSLFYASTPRDGKLIREEYAVRKKHGLPVRLMESGDILREYGIRSACALENNVSGQLDAYHASTGLLAYNTERHGLKIYSHTEVISWVRENDGYTLVTTDGHTIKADYVVIAAGFEGGRFLPGKPMKLTTTFAIISEPVDESALWKDKALIWETRQPYLYIRTDGNRIIVGGEDENFNSARARRFLIARKAGILERKFRNLLPQVPFKTEGAWAGTFSSTSDGLPLVGPAEGDERMLYALGYGGNGITFSMIAAQVITARIKGGYDAREKIFSADRKSLR